MSGPFLNTSGDLGYCPRCFTVSAFPLNHRNLGEPGEG